jgi:GTPase SAR1 family protein
MGTSYSTLRFVSRDTIAIILLSEPRLMDRYTLNVWDVGGQRTLRPYWRNYFESTDAVVWVVDSSDRLRVTDCKDELGTLLQEEVSQSLVLIRHLLESGPGTLNLGPPSCK